MKALQNIIAKEGAWSLMSEPAREKRKIKSKKESNMKIGHIVEACEKDVEKEEAKGLPPKKANLFSAEEDQILKDLGKGKGTPKKPDLKKGLKRESQFDLDQADTDVDADGPIRRKDFPVRNRMDASKLTAAVEGCEQDDAEEQDEEFADDDAEEKDEDMTPEIGDKMGRSDLGNVGRKGWNPTAGKATEAFSAFLDDASAIVEGKKAKKELRKLHGRKYERPKTGYKHESLADLLA